MGGHWKYLYRAVDRVGQTVDFLLTAKRDVAAARRFLGCVIDLNGLPDKISIDLLQKGDSLAPAEPWASMKNTGEW